MWEDRFQESISIMDWFDLYIPLVAQYMGNQEPWTTTGQELEEVTQKLIEIKPNIRSLSPDLGTVIQDLANRDAAIAWGASSNDTSIGLRMDGHEVVLTIPKQGGAMFTEALVIAKDTPHYATAVAYLDFMTSPEVQAMMAWNDTMKVAVTNSRVDEYLTPEQFEILNMDKADDWVANSVLSRAPEDLDAWVEAWEQFKAA
jgi:spermidine/putrescine-binding protein